MTENKSAKHWGRRLQVLLFALLSSLFLASPLLAQTSQELSHGIAERVPSSKESVLSPIDPQSLVPVTVPNDIGDEPLGAPVRNPFSDPDPSLQSSNTSRGVDQLSDPDLIFNGLNSNSNPPDTVGDVGPDHYIQMTNPGSFQVFNKDGTNATPPLAMGNLWPAGDNCRTMPRGDPIVVYDHLADRWLMAQFAFTGNGTVGPFFLCFALSTTATPDAVPANWYLWTVNVDTNGNANDEFPDYPKIGVWPDAYYMTTHEGTPSGVFAMDRANMLNGNAFQWVKTTIGKPTPNGGVRFTRILPADLDGDSPPAGSPGIFLRTVDGAQDILGSDRIEIYEFDVNWADPGASSFGSVNNIGSGQGLIGFNIMGCDRNSTGLMNALRDCIPVPSGGTADALSNRAMMQLKYRNFGTHETMVVNQTVDVRPALNAQSPGLGFDVDDEVAGIRWYELRRDDGETDWSIFQQGTYSLQNAPADEGEILHRWMGSIAMDRFGNMGLGYSLSSDDDDHPGIRYAGRSSDDPLGLLPEGEKSVVEGTTSPAGTGTRWGDYSAMSVDPVDDCTFWFTTHIDSGEAQRTRIASFRFADCNADLEVSKTANPDPATAGEQITYTIDVTNNGPLDATDIVVVDSLPDDVTYVSDNVPGDECGVAGQIITCQIGDLDSGNSTNFTITALVESDILQIPDGPISVENLVEGSAAEADSNEENNSFTLATLVNESADLQVEKLCKPDEPAVVGEETGECEIFVTNHGPSMARNVEMVDEIFSNGSYTVVNIDTDPSGSCNEVEGDVICDLGDIDAGNVVKVTVEVDTTEAVDINDIATATSDTPDPDTSNNSDQGSITFIIPSADVIVTKQCQPITPAPAGSEGFCEIFVFNNGPSVAVDVQLDDQIASDGDYEVTNISTSVGTCSATGANVDVQCDLDDIAAGATETVVVTFTTDDEVDVDDIATATSLTFDPDPNNNTDTGSVSFTGIANLSITKTDNGATVDAGTNLIYVLDVANAGPSAAANVVVSDIIPAGTQVISAAVTVGTGSCVVGVPGDPLQPTECGLGEIASGGAAQVTIEIFVLPGATGTLNNDATVSSDTYDDDNGDNRATEATPILVNTDLVLTKTADQDPVTAGSELKYNLSLVNNGPSTATDVMLVDMLPAETHWVKTKVLGGVGDCVLSGADPDVVTCTLNDMEPGEMFLVVITVLVDPSTEAGPITNYATASESSGEGDMADVTVTVNAEADLWIDKTGLFLTDNPSRTILYTLTVHNDSGCSGDDPQVCGNGGPSDAQDVVVFDELPSTNKKLVVTFWSEDCDYDYPSHTVTCTTPTLAAGDTVFHEIEARPRGSLRAITNTATVSSSTSDPDASNNTDDMLIIVGGGGQK